MYWSLPILLSFSATAAGVFRFRILNSIKFLFIIVIISSPYASRKSTKSFAEDIVIWKNYYYFYKKQKNHNLKKMIEIEHLIIVDCRLNLCNNSFIDRDEFRTIRLHQFISYNHLYRICNSISSWISLQKIKII